MKMLNARSALFAVITSATAFSVYVEASDEWVELGQSDNGIRFAVSKDTPISGAGVFTGRQRLTMPYPVKCADMDQLKAANPDFYGYNVADAKGVPPAHAVDILPSLK